MPVEMPNIMPFLMTYLEVVAVVGTLFLLVLAFRAKKMDWLIALLIPIFGGFAAWLEARRQIKAGNWDKFKEGKENGK